jgi:hypothetical protein
MPVIGVDRRGQYDEVGLPHSVFGVYNVTIDCAQLDRSFQVFDTPPDPYDPRRQALSAKNHPKRSADQPDSDNRHLGEMKRHSSRWTEAEPQS